MDNQKRGELLVEKEDTEEKIKELRQRLRTMGNTLRMLGDQLMSSPESLVLSNPPSDATHLCSYSFFPTGGINWNDIADRMTVATVAKELRDAVEQLSRVKSQLSSYSAGAR